jgi:hypothetical protein
MLRKLHNGRCNEITKLAKKIQPRREFINNAIESSTLHVSRRVADGFYESLQDSGRNFYFLWGFPDVDKLN